MPLKSFSTKYKVKILGRDSREVINRKENITQKYS